MNRLAIGQRGKRTGWTTLDAHPKSGADIVSSVPPLPAAVTDQTWDEIEMIHVLEHFYYWEAQTLLGQIHACLAPGGKLVIECPNIEYAARVLLGQEPRPRGHKDQFDLWPLYGDPSHRDTLYGHHWGYSPASLEVELKRVGFVKFAHMRAKSHFPVRDFRVEATKSGPS